MLLPELFVWLVCLPAVRVHWLPGLRLKLAYAVSKSLGWNLHLLPAVAYELACHQPDLSAKTRLQPLVSVKTC